MKVVLKGKVVGQEPHTDDWTVVVDGEGSEIWKMCQKSVTVTLELDESEEAG